MKLNSRNATSVRQKIQASQLINRLQSFATGADDPQTGKPVEMSGTQVKAACYLISQAIGSPPQEVTSEVTVTAHVAVHALVARLGVERARQALEIQAPGLVALLPSNGQPMTVDAEMVEAETDSTDSRHSEAN